MLADPRWRNLALAALALLALGAGALGVVLGSRQDDDGAPAADLPEPGRAQPQDRVSFLARIIPPAAGSGRGLIGVPRGVVRASRPTCRCERKVGQLFLYGFTGQDSSAEVFRRLEPLGLGGIVVAGPNYAGADGLRALAAEARAVAEAACPPS